MRRPTPWAIFAGCLPVSWLMRTIVAVLMVIGLLITLMFSVQATVGLVTFGSRFPMGGWYFWAGVGSAVLIVALGIGLLQVLSVALLSPKPSNRMLITRLYVRGIWAVTAVVAGVWSYYERNIEPMFPWVVLLGIVLMIFAVVSLGERDTWSCVCGGRFPAIPCCGYWRCFSIQGQRGESSGTA